ncbi:hypothetical protein [Piscinibacter gummiphilus]|uniref:hypothetical protein n=1 Tax=Piscinibacter gummiphilus TaxID=946333 RepID=UPI0012F51424|nr:hypothetical protein [Piscinibacter gummiphilus]GLS95842.1 hypothetical protein GCM10007918_31340 [Piscinibacter gummiphilus]
MHYVHVEPSRAVILSPAGLGSYAGAQFRDAWMDSVRAPQTNSEYSQMFVHASSGEVLEAASVKSYRLAAGAKRWQRHVLDPHATADVDALTETVEAALEFISEFGPPTLSLEYFRSGSVQCEHLAAVLRASCSWRQEIPGWDEAVEVARVAAEAAGLDPEDVLYGLI